MSKAWYWWKIIWTVIRNILYLLLILLAFDKASSAFENVVFCLLILILQSITWAHTTQMRFSIEEAFSNKRALFLLLRRDAGEMVNEEVEEGEKLVDEAHNKYQEQTPLYYINAVGSGIVYLLVLWKVFETLI
jgi:hypothetical protein